MIPCVTLFIFVSKVMQLFFELVLALYKVFHFSMIYECIYIYIFIYIHIYNIHILTHQHFCYYYFNVNYIFITLNQSMFCFIYQCILFLFQLADSFLSMCSLMSSIQIKLIIIPDHLYPNGHDRNKTSTWKPC